MTLVFPLLEQPICFRENRVNVLILEEPNTLRRAVEELTAQLGGEPGPFVLAQDHVPQELSRAAAMITDPFHIDLESKKLSNRITQMAVSAAENHEDKVWEILTAINELAAEIRAELDFEATFSELDYPDEIIRILGFRLDREEMSLPEILLEWMRIQRRLFGKSLFIVYGLKACVAEEDLRSLYRSVFYEKLDLLMIEPWQRGTPLPEETVTIIDKDLCVIV